MIKNEQPECSIQMVSNLLDISLTTARRWDRMPDNESPLKSDSRTAGGHRRYLQSDLFKFLKEDTSVNTLIYVGNALPDCSEAIRKAKTYCKRQEWKSRANVADAIWSDLDQPERSAKLRNLLMNASYVRVVLPSPEAAAPMTYPGLKLFCENLGIEVCLLNEAGNGLRRDV